MLQKLRKNLNRKSLFAYVVFGAICLVFVFFGYDGSGPTTAGYAARVNDKVISIYEYRRNLDRMIEFYSRLFGGNFSPEAQEQFRVRDNALNQLIQNEAVSQGAEEEGFRVTDYEISDYIMNIPAFQKDGKFNRSYYDNYIASQRISVRKFEDQIRREIMVNKIRQTFEGTFQLSSLEEEKQKQLSESQVNVSFLRVKDVKAIKDDKGAEVTPEQLNIEAVEKAFQGNPQEGVKLALAKGSKWEDTGAFSLDSASIPKVGVSSEFALEAFRLKKAGEIAPQTIRVAGALYILKLKSHSKSAKKEEKPANTAAKKSNGIFSLWSEKLMADYKIERNLALTQGR